MEKDYKKTMSVGFTF